MKWKTANFQSKDIADMCAAEFRIAGIRTGEVFQAEVGKISNTRYFVPYMPVGEEQKETANEIISNHIW